MILYLSLMAAGLAILIIGADCLVKGSSRLALSMGISPLVVGLSVVAFGTSAPELSVSITSSLSINLPVIGHVWFIVPIVALRFSVASQV